MTTGLYAGKPGMYPRVPETVTISAVNRTISREGRGTGTLNDYTPCPLRTKGEDIVCSPWRHGEVGRNDRLPAKSGVTTRYGGVIRWLAAPGEEFDLALTANGICCVNDLASPQTSSYGLTWTEF